MKKYLILGLLIVVIVLLGGTALAVKPNTARSIATNNHSGRVVTIPQRAIEMAPGVFNLGTAQHQGEIVEGYAIVHYKEKPAKPSGCNNNGICERGENAKKCPTDCGGGSEEPPSDTSSSCYGFLAKSAKWKVVENWVVNPTNNEGLSSDFILSNLSADIDKWETSANTDILGYGATTSETLSADTIEPDDQNEVYFGSIDSPGAIAVTIIWGIFGGSPKNRKLVEWDQVYDEVDFDWSDNGDLYKMDFESIATHELGHSLGMADLYTTECLEQTMYGYAGNGETNKRTLEAGDITGIKALYK